MKCCTVEAAEARRVLLASAAGFQGASGCFTAMEAARPRVMMRLMARDMPRSDTATVFAPTPVCSESPATLAVWGRTHLLSDAASVRFGAELSDLHPGAL